MTDSIDSLLKQLNVLIQSTTDLSNHANITKDEIDNKTNSAKEQSVSITNDKDIITESKTQALTAKEEILTIENQIEDKIYTDKATIISAENKSPIAKSDGYLDHNWMESINIPSEAVSLPLKENLYLDKGKGQLDTIDLSQAQDGSQLIEIPNTDKAIVKGDYQFSKAIETITAKSSNIANTFSLKNRSVSRNEKVKMAFNFYNTGEYLQIEPFNFTDNAEIIIDLFLEAGGEVLGNIEKNDNLRIDKDTTTNLTRVALSIDKSFLRESLDADYTNKSLTLKLNCTKDKTEILFKDTVILTYEKKMFPVSLIGITASSDASSLAGRYSGQIQKIEFKDLTNTDNSKVINTVIEVDNLLDSETFTYPKAEETPLKDIIGKSNFYAPFVGVKSDNTYYNGNQSTMPNSKGEKWVRGVIFKEEYNQMTTLPRGEKCGSYLSGMPFSVDSLLVANNSVVKIVKLYNALTINFEIVKGTDQSVIDDFQYPNTFIEVKSTDPNYDDYLKPEPEPEPEPEVPDTKPTIPKDNNVTTINDAEGLVLNGELIPSTEPANRSISAELGEVEYTPANPKGYTPLFDGTGTSITLDEDILISDNFSLLFTIYVDEILTNNTRVYGKITNGEDRNYFGYVGNSWQIGIGKNIVNLDISVTTGIHVILIERSDTVIKIKINDVVKTLPLDGTLSTISTIGALNNIRDNVVNENWKGLILDFKYTDLSNPKNSRHYPLVEYSDTEPTTRIVRDVLNNKNGKMIGFPETNAFIETDERPTLIADGDSVAQWTVNYDGANVCLDLLEWVGGEVRFNTFIHSGMTGWRWFFDGRQRHQNSYLAMVTDKVQFREEYFDVFVDGKLVRNNVTQIGYGFHSFRVVPKNQNVYIEFLGAKDGLYEIFKGQISNLKLIDYNDPENCRFYKGTIYSYADPESTNVQIPNVTILKDEWCDELLIEDKIIHIPELAPYTLFDIFTTLKIGNRYLVSFEPENKTAQYQPTFFGDGNYHSGDYEAEVIAKNTKVAIKATGVKFPAMRAKVKIKKRYNIITEIPESTSSFVEVLSENSLKMIELNDSYSQPISKKLDVGRMYFVKGMANLISGSARLRINNIDDMVLPKNGSFNHIFQATGINPISVKRASGPTTGIIEKLEVKETTHGTIRNPNSIQPWVPLLGNREYFCTNFNGIFQDKQYSRGLHLNDTHALIRPEGMSTSQIIPKGTLFIKESFVIKLTYTGLPITGVYHNGTKDQIQKAFQYPNVFKVIKPTDPDYEYYNNLYTKKEE